MILRLIAALAHQWDKQNLLLLHKEPIIPYHRVKVFNCFKDDRRDRQIGDRRGRNLCEKALRGPSSSLPTGPDFCQLCVCPKSQKLSISVSDRKDYYHQVEVSRLRALANTVGPAIPESLVKDTQSYAAFVLSSARKKKSRSQEGDNLHDRPLCVLANDGMITVAFTSIFQGDHAGVEFATSAHEGLLHSFGCLSPRSRMISFQALL